MKKYKLSWEEQIISSTRICVFKLCLCKKVFIEDEEAEYVEEYENFIGLEYRCSEEELEGIINTLKSY